MASLFLPLTVAYCCWALLSAVAGLRMWPVSTRCQHAVWLGWPVAWALLAIVPWTGWLPAWPEPVKRAIDSAVSPMTVTLAAYVLLAVAAVARGWWTRPAVAWSMLNLFLLWLGLSLPDAEFMAVVGQPDNVAIVGMVVLLGVCLWSATAQAVENDRRAGLGRPSVEHEYSETVLVWPDLVYIELIAMILVSVLLVVWSVVLQAPLEAPANPTLTPNPSKAPWYFLGLQELLAYSDAWWVGVVVPTLILIGLAAIPYVDRNPAGVGYYTIRSRRFAVGVFVGGFLLLWILPILIGVFMRGPNWAAFGPYEPRDARRAGEQATLKLSHWFWSALGQPVPEPANGASGWARFSTVLWRESAGIVLLTVYLIGTPILLRWTWMRPLRSQLGSTRFWIVTILLVLMLTLPLKMLLRWTLGLGYVVSMPEYALSF
ncbi:MAG: hypothetical protein ACOY3P_18260 [Planctomycetota bacterium]